MNENKPKYQPICLQLSGLEPLIADENSNFTSRIFQDFLAIRKSLGEPSKIS